MVVALVVVVALVELAPVAAQPPAPDRAVAAAGQEVGAREVAREKNDGGEEDAGGVSEEAEGAKGSGGAREERAAAQRTAEVG